MNAKRALAEWVLVGVLHFDTSAVVAGGYYQVAAADKGGRAGGSSGDRPGEGDVDGMAVGVESRRKEPQRLGTEHRVLVQ